MKFFFLLKCFKFWRMAMKHIKMYKNGRLHIFTVLNSINLCFIDNYC